MQHLIGALTGNFRFIRLRRFRGRRPARPAGDGETRVVSAKCLLSLNGHLLRPGGTSPSCSSFTRFIVEQCLLKKASIWPLLTVWKLPGHHIVPKCRRHQTYSDAPPPPELFHIGIVCLLLWPIPSPQRSLGHYLFKQKFSKKIFFSFLKISKLALPDVMLKYERGR